MVFSSRVLAVVFAAALGLGATACGSAAPPMATHVDAERAAKRWPGTTLADLNRGRRLYRSRCSSCHLPVHPKRIKPSDWPGHVSEMAIRAHLNHDEKRLVVRYLITMSTATPANKKSASAKP